MPARCFLNRTPLCRYRFFLRLAFSPCSWFSGLRQVPDLRPERADFSFVWLCVRIHGESLAFLISKKNKGCSCGRNKKSEQGNSWAESVKQPAQRDRSEGTARHRDCIKHRNQTRGHSVCFVKVKTN